MKTAIFALLFSLATVPALAGTVIVHDTINLLTPQELQALQADTSHDFDLHVLIEDSQGNLQQHTLEAVNAPNVMAIGLDPGARKTSVRYGGDVAEFTGGNIAKAGDIFFKQKQWLNGLQAIAARGHLRAATAAAPVQVHQHRQQAEEDGTWIVVLICLAFLMFVGGIAWYIHRRDKEEAAEDERAARRAEARASVSFIPSAPATSCQSYPYQASAPPAQTTIVNNDSGSGLTTLLAYEVGRASSQHNSPPPRAPTPKPRRASTPRPSFGSSDSSWGSSSSPSSSSDWGGGSSGGGGSGASWDGGGDSGGGGDSSW